DRLGPGADRRLAERLLGDVILVEGWSMALRIVARHPHVRAVTPEGDLVSVYGVRVAHPDGATPAMVEAAEVALERAEIELARVESLHTSAKRGFENARAGGRGAVEPLSAVDTRSARAGEALVR